jgi:hypothetical protein
MCYYLVVEEEGKRLEKGLTSFPAFGRLMAIEGEDPSSY